MAHTIELHPETVTGLRQLASWSDNALEAWLEHTDIATTAEETDAEYNHRCYEQWTASGDRAIAEEATANAAADIAQRILDQVDAQ